MKGATCNPSVKSNYINSKTKIRKTYIVCSGSRFNSESHNKMGFAEISAGVYFHPNT